MRLFFFISFIFFVFCTNAQRITIDSLKIKIVSIDPSSKRVFVSYDYFFDTKSDMTGASFLANIKVIRDTLEKYVRCLFKLERISFFANHWNAKYMPLESNKKDYLQWSKDYLGEYIVSKREYIIFPVNKVKSKAVIIN